MNHDYAHCLDHSKSCQADCFRAKLVRDLKTRIDLLGIPITWQHFAGTLYCPLKEKHHDKT